MAENLVLMERSGYGSMFVSPSKVKEYMEAGWKVSENQPQQPEPVLVHEPVSETEHEGEIEHEPEPAAQENIEKVPPKETQKRSKAKANK